MINHLTYVGMSIRDSKIYPKSIEVSSTEDPKISKGAMNPFRMEPKCTRMYGLFGFGLTQVYSLSSLYTISCWYTV